MRTRLVLATTLAVAAAGVGIAIGLPSGSDAPKPAVAQTASPKPNVVFVLVDDMSSDLLHYMPNVRKLQQDGTSFSKYIVSDSLCCPSRSSTFTGRLPHDTGVFTNTPPDGGYATFTGKGNDPISYGNSLQRAGYRTAMMGKYLNGYQPQSNGVPPGWDEWDVAGNGYPEFNYALNVNGAIEQHGNQPQDYLTDVLAGKATGFIDSSVDQGKPFAMEVATFAPHGPSTPAPRDVGKFAGQGMPRVSSFNRANVNAPKWLRRATKLTPQQVKNMDMKHDKRARSLIAVDEMVGKLRNELQAKGVADNTYVVFSSDNGFHLGQHQLLGGKQTAFDHDIRVPLVVAGPGVKASATSDALVQNTDLAPTFEQISGQPADPKRDGRSFLALLEGQTPGDWRDAAVIEHHGRDFRVGDPDVQSKKAGMPTTYTAIRTANATYVEYRDGEREYYDDVRDPQQRVNAYRKLPASTKARLHARVAKLRTCHGAAQCATR